jgi:hypothetical protein
MKKMNLLQTLSDDLWTIAEPLTCKTAHGLIAETLPVLSTREFAQKADPLRKPECMVLF